MKPPSVKPVRCAIYTRVSTEHGLDQEFNSLDAQYDAASAYIKSQAHAGWALIRSRYDDGGYSGGSTDRPDLQRLLDDIRARKIDVIVVYKVDRLTRSLADFAKLGSHLSVMLTGSAAPSARSSNMRARSNRSLALGIGHLTAGVQLPKIYASLIGRLGSSAFRLSTTIAVSMSLTGSCFSSESAPRPLYGVFFVKELARAAKLSFVGFLVRSQSPFLRPDLRIADVDARRICTRLAVTPTLRHTSPLPGHTLTASSTTAR